MNPHRPNPTDVARNRSLFASTSVIIIFAATVPLIALLLERVEEDVLRWLLALMPIVLLSLWVWQFYRMVRNDDEMMQTLYLRAVAVSAMLVLIGGTMWGLLERLLAVPALPAFVLLPGFALVFGFIWSILARHQ